MPKKSSNKLNIYEYLKYEMFELALVYGMTANQYWFQDPELFYNYKTAFENRNKMREQELWVQGAYVKSAIESSVLNVVGMTDYKKFKVPDYIKCPNIGDSSNQEEVALTEKQIENERLRAYAFFKSLGHKKS